MSYLLDTNILSETVRRAPNKSVLAWLDRIPGEALFVSVLTLGEIRKGIEAITDKKRREKLRLWLEHELPVWFEAGCFPWTLPSLTAGAASWRRSAARCPPSTVFSRQQHCIMSCGWLPVMPRISSIPALK